MKIDFSQNLRTLMTQLSIPNAQLAKALNVDPSLVSRWLKVGCGERKASEHALSIGRFVAKKRLSPENSAWLAATIGKADGTRITAERIALWLYPKATLADTDDTDDTDEYPNLLLVGSFHSSVESPGAWRLPDDERIMALSIGDGAARIAELLREELSQVAEGMTIEIFLSSESTASAVDLQMLQALRAVVQERKLAVRMLVQSANNSAMTSRLISGYMPLLVQGRLTLSVIQGTPQTFSSSMNILIPARCAIVITETAQRRSSAIATVIRDKTVMLDMHDSFENSARYARSMMTAYNDSFARSIIEIFFEEYGVPGSLDVIKCGMNPMYMTVEQYGEVLRKFGHTEDQYIWRYSEFVRFKTAMDEVLRTSRFREVLSLPKLQQIAQTGRCRMPATYFAEVGTWDLDARDCVDIFDGYIRYIHEIPDFQVVLLEDEQLFMPNSCWHIKNNRHVVIHSWNIDDPIMVYSDQLILIDEFQTHFDKLWEETKGGVTKRSVLKTLTELRDQCAGHIE